MNTIVISGNTGHSAVSRTTDKGGMVTFSLAVNDRRKNEQGEYENARTDWFDCVVYTQTAEGASSLGKAITAGTRLLIHGEMQSRQYEKDGIKRTAWSVIVRELEFIGERRKEDEPEAQAAEPAPEPKENKEPEQTKMPF